MFSTYYTSVFLKHGGKKEKVDFHPRQLEVVSGASPQRIKSAETSFISVLKSMSRPQLLTLYRFAGSLFLGIFAHPKIFEWGKRLTHTMAYAGDFALPAVFLFTANYCNSVALDRIGISLTYTSKCVIPLITVLMTLLADGFSALPSNAALLALIPIASGVGLASWNSPTFEKRGFIAAMVSSTAQAALNVSSKRALIKTGISGLEAQTAMASVAFSIAICMTGYTCVKQKDPANVNKENDRALPPVWLSAAAAAAYHFEYVLSFLFLSLVQPISYGTCDAIRRLGIIIAGRSFFGGEPFSMLNYSGIGLALLGAMGYSIASAKK